MTSPPPLDSAADAFLRRRLWLLLVFDGLEHAGLTPLAGARVHAFVYFADALSPLYDLPQIDGETLKRKRGPFYPDVQWDLDRLATQGLLTVEQINWKEEDDDTVFEAEYGLSNAGAEAASLLVSRPDGKRTRDFLGDLAVAFARARDNDVADATLVDANYGRRTTKQGELVQFTPVLGDLDSVRRNFSQEVADSFDKHVNLKSPLTDAEKLHLYVNALRRASHGR